HVLDVQAAELAALLVDVLLEAVLDRIAERSVGAGIRQHESDLDRLGLRRCAQCQRSKRRRNGQPGCLDTLHRISSWGFSDTRHYRTGSDAARLMAYPSTAWTRNAAAPYSGAHAKYFSCSMLSSTIVHPTA